MDSKWSFQIVIPLVYLTVPTYQQDMPFDGPGSFVSRHHSHHHHSTSAYSDSFSTASTPDTSTTSRDTFRPDPDYYESPDMNGPPPDMNGPPPDGPRYGASFTLPPPAPMTAPSPKNAKPQVHGAVKKFHWIDRRTEKKFFRNISNAQLELKKELRNTNLRIEVVHKNVKNVRTHLFGIEVLGSIVFVAKMLIPVIKDYFYLRKAAPAYDDHNVDVPPPPRKPVARSRQSQ